MQKILLVFVLLLSSSCTQIAHLGCAAEVAAAHTLAPAVATALECDELQVENDFVHVADTTLFCKQAPQPVAGVKGMDPTICALAVNAFVAFAQPKAQAALPANWNCKLNNASASLAGILTAACTAIPL